jgi:hypothetical protein
MTATVTLGSGELEAALAVLKREQSEYMPSPRQQLCFRLFNWSIHLFVAVILCNLIAMIVGADDIVLQVNAVAFGVLSLAVVVCFFLNLGLIWKLVRHAKLRRRLRLAGKLRTAFKAKRRSGRLRNILTALIAVFGAFFVPVGAVLFVVMILIMIDDSNPDLQNYLAISSVASTALILGISLVSLHFMRRGKERLDVITGLQASLLQGKEDPAGRADVASEISTSAYDKIARMERAHIIADRAQSIKSAAKEAADSSYLIQMSRDLAGAKAQLDSHSRLQVDDEVLKLMTEPRPPEAKTDSKTGHLLLRVPETSVSIRYDIDEAGHRIRLYTLESAA